MAAHCTHRYAVCCNGMRSIFSSITNSNRTLTKCSRQSGSTDDCIWASGFCMWLIDCPTPLSLSVCLSLTHSIAACVCCVVVVDLHKKSLLDARERMVLWPFIFYSIRIPKPTTRAFHSEPKHNRNQWCRRCCSYVVCRVQNDIRLQTNTVNQPTRWDIFKAISKRLRRFFLVFVLSVSALPICLSVRHMHSSNSHPLRYTILSATRTDK